MRSRARLSVLLLLVTVLSAAVTPSAVAAAVTPPSTAEVVAAEQGALTQSNKHRTDRGLVALRWDERLGALARERAEYMARTGTFSHTQDGKSAFQMMTDRGITWYSGGEIIAWNTAGDLDDSRAFAVKSWMDSPPHKAIMLSTGYNYVGFGVAVSPTSGKRYWAGVYLKGPDRTGAWVGMGSITKATVDATQTKVKATWTGGDQKLQVLTSGLRYYEVHIRRDGGGWVSLGTTTSTALYKTWIRGSDYEVRVRARDKAGLWSPWVSKVIPT